MSVSDHLKASDDIIEALKADTLLNSEADGETLAVQTALAALSNCETRINHETTIWRGDSVSDESDVESKQLGPYRIEQQLGHGGMGVVYLAEDVDLQRKVALKVIKPNSRGGLSRVNVFLRKPAQSLQFNTTTLSRSIKLGNTTEFPLSQCSFCKAKRLVSDSIRQGGCAKTKSLNWPHSQRLHLMQYTQLV